MTIKPQFENKKPPGDVYATEVPTRKPKFKIHKNIGHAKNAIHWHKGSLYKRFWPTDKPPEIVEGAYCRMFKLVDDKWVYLPELSVEIGVTHELVGTPTTYMDSYLVYELVPMENHG